MTVTPVLDTLGRPLRSLRVSVTDRCNLRCHYCMPEQEYVWLPRQSLLSFEEIARLTSVFTGLGVEKVRITGGEPLLRHDLPTLVRMLRTDVRIRDIALTTNGVMLGRHAQALMDAGLGRVTISLDTLQPKRFADFARSPRLEDVLTGIDTIRRIGFTGTKLNAVITRENADEVPDLFEFASSRDMEVRFVEYMDVGGATQWSMTLVVSREEILTAMRARYGSVVAIDHDADPSAPAERFRTGDGRTFGIIASTTAPFCRSCDRSRITADGMYFLCLYADNGTDLRGPIRDGATDHELAEIIRCVWQERSDRGAEARHAQPSRAPLYQIAGLRSDPHREMHTRGG